MGAIAEWFRGGGVWMYMILAVALTSHPAAFLTALVALLAKEKYAKAVMVLGLFLGLMVVVTVGIGGAGYAVGMMELEEALSKAAPGMRERMVERGERYAMYPLNFAMIATPIPLLTALFALFRSRSLGKG